MKCFANGEVFLNREFVQGNLFVEDGKILGLDVFDVDQADEVIDCTNEFVVPGFLDIHCHGGVGVDTMDGKVESIAKLAKFVASNGTCALLPTTMTMPLMDVTQALWAVDEAMKAEVDGAEILGVHAEGPFINPDKKGAQKADNILKPSVAAFEKMVGEFGHVVRTITLAPEIEGAEELIRYLKKKGIVAIVGHTCATYEQAVKSVDWGVSHCTHLYNAMTGLDHRAPGVVGAMFDLDDATVEMIADLIHVHPAALRIAIEHKGIDKVALITDAMEAAGLPDGEYALGGQPVFVKDGAARLASGALAGSTLNQQQALRNIVSIGRSLEDAIVMLTETPAHIIHMQDSHGKLDKGYTANVTVLNKDLFVTKTFVKGTQVF